MTPRRRAAVRALIALTAAAATPHVWVAALAVLYLLRLGETELRLRAEAHDRNEHPDA